MIIVENNSCGAGQKSMPSKNDDLYSGYRTVAENFLAIARKHTHSSVGGLAVIYDKNEIEAHGNACMLSEVSKEPVWFVEYSRADPDPPVKWVDNVMQVRDQESIWHPIRAAFKYVTQKPWLRIPLKSRTLIVNSILGCLCGGRNKVMGFRAYADFNTELLTSKSGLQIELLETIVNVKLSEIKTILANMGGRGVIKVPYLSGGRGVHTIATDEDMKSFFDSQQSQQYEHYVVQALVEPLAWKSSTSTSAGVGERTKNYHVGTGPDESNNSYVNDIRMLVCAGEKGFQPITMFSRRARIPIAPLETYSSVPGMSSSWEMLGTNLTSKSDHFFMKTTEADRLLVFDTENFSNVNLSMDDLVNGYVQSVLSVIAIDKLCRRLIKPDGEFNKEYFAELNPDSTLLEELHISKNTSATI